MVLGDSKWFMEVKNDIEFGGWCKEVFEGEIWLAIRLADPFDNR